MVKLENLSETQRPAVLTPDSMDEFYKEPEPWGKVQRCNRCLSTDIIFGES